MGHELDLRQLEYFLAVVENRSFGRTAEILHISQPALSKAVKRLEQDLGVRLLDRLPRGVAPTLYGEALVAHAKLIKGELSRATDAIVALKEGNAGRVVIGAGSSMRIELLPEAVVRLHARHPDLEVKMIGELYDDLIPDLEKGELDLALSMISFDQRISHIEEIPLYIDKTHPTVRTDHPLLKKKTITIEDCLKSEWILPSSDNLGRRHLDAFFLSRGYSAPESVIETNSTMIAVSVMQKSDLIGWHPTQVIGNSNVTGLTALPIEEITLTRTVGISYRQSSVLSPAAILLIEELKRVSAEMIENKTVMPLS
jgi:DNA-binding transcriptional LysR family regulator